MYVTIKNTGKSTKITNMRLFVMSHGTEGVSTTENINKAEYITYCIDDITPKYQSAYNRYARERLHELYGDILAFYQANPNFSNDKNISGKWYTEFSIPKKKKTPEGKTKWRHLKNPQPSLKELQKKILNTLNDIKVLPSNAAQAFRAKRDYYTNAEVHMNNNHIVNLDFSNYFDTITEDIIIDKFMQHPVFSVEPSFGYDLVKAIADIATQNGVTGQGSPLSPYIANMICVEFDYKMRKRLNENPLRIKYTRYADDITFSCKKSMDIKYLIELTESLLDECFDGVIKLNREKTKKLVPGKCFITGCKLNKEHKLTVGWEKKKLIKNRLYNLFNNKVPEDEMLKEARYLDGYLSFMKRVEPGYTDYIIRKYDARRKIRQIINTKA